MTTTDESVNERTNNAKKRRSEDERSWQQRLSEASTVLEFAKALFDCAKLVLDFFRIHRLARWILIFVLTGGSIALGFVLSGGSASPSVISQIASVAGKCQPFSTGTDGLKDVDDTSICGRSVRVAKLLPGVTPCGFYTDNNAPNDWVGVSTDGVSYAIEPQLGNNQQSATGLVNAVTGSVLLTSGNCPS